MLHLYMTNARSSLSALHAARTCLFGDRQLGDRKWYADKPGIAFRLKTQTERRQFGLGLVVKLALYNKLNVSDLHLQFHSGDRSGLPYFSSSLRMTILTLLFVAALASLYDQHQIFALDKPVVLDLTLPQIIAGLADYVHSSKRSVGALPCRHL